MYVPTAPLPVKTTATNTSVQTISFKSTPKNAPTAKQPSMAQNVSATIISSTKLPTIAILAKMLIKFIAKTVSDINSRILAIFAVEARTTTIALTIVQAISSTSIHTSAQNAPLPAKIPAPQTSALITSSSPLLNNVLTAK